MTIDDAGYGAEFDRELAFEAFDLMEGHTDQEYREHREREVNRKWQLSRIGNAVDSFATRLSEVLDAPFDQCRGVAMDMLGFAPRRRTALELLERMASQVRRVQQQATRQRFSGRRSA